MAKRRIPALDLLAWIPTRALIALLAWAPERPVYGLVAAAGRLWFRLAGARRTIALANLRLALGDGRDAAALTALGRRATGEVFRVLVDVARTPRLLRSGGFARRVEDHELAEAAAEAARLAPGRGPIICSPHLGSWEAGSFLLARQFGELDVIARPMPNPWLQRWLVANRSRAGQRIHPRRGGIRALRRGLRRGAAAVFLPDQNQRIGGIFVPVFGKMAACDRSPAGLALLGGHPIIVAAMLRDGPGYRFRARIARVFLPAQLPGEDREAAITRTTRDIHAAVETLIRETPEQYFWVHNRYRTRPPEERDRAAS
ncbi:MAG: lysophospholipid acyltransferase family protein [Planctomycetota bacterium]